MSFKIIFCVICLMVVLLVTIQMCLLESGHAVCEYFQSNVQLLQLRPRTTGFQIVSDNGPVYVFSAYFDASKRRIRVIGLTPNTSRPNLFCVLWYNVTQIVVPGYVANINENHGHRITAAYILCDICNLPEPLAVSVVEGLLEKNKTDIPGNVLGINSSNDWADNKPRFLSACLSPLHDNFSDSSRLMEWIELNSILGVDYFTVYRETVTREVEAVLEYYLSKGFVEVVNWNIPVSDIHYHGQLAAINDCLYRNKERTEYLMITDVDEFIIPQQENCDTIPNIISASGNRKSAYVFRHTRYYAPKNVSRAKEKATGLITQTFVIRDKEINKKGDRSKLIVSTRDTVTLGIHEVWALRKGKTVHVVDTKLALLHHYRGDTNEYNGQHNAALKYGVHLENNVRKVYSDMRVQYRQHT